MGMNCCLVLFGALMFIQVAKATDAPQKPVVILTPFEPPYSEFYNPNDKFAHPKEIIAPRPLWPFEKRGPDSVEIGEVVVLVQLNTKGFARRIAVLASTDPLFTRDTIFALEKARWEPLPREVWFYYRAHFDFMQMLEKEPNQETKPKAVRPAASASEPVRRGK